VTHNGRQSVKCNPLVKGDAERVTLLEGAGKRIPRVKKAVSKRPSFRKKTRSKSKSKASSLYNEKKAPLKKDTKLSISGPGSCQAFNN